MANEGDADVIIVGGGPAGATLASLLAQAGHEVLVLEKQVFPRYRIGESLLPATVRDLADMVGVREHFEQAGFRVKRGASFSWGRDEQAIWHLNFGGTHSLEPQLRPEVPAAFNVPRATFDAILLDNAIANGARLQSDCRAERLIESQGRVTGVLCRDAAGRQQQLRARHVVDASGQQSRLARQIGQRTLSVFFARQAFWRYFDHAARRPEPLSGNTFFQARNGSWCWFIPLDDTLTSVGVVAPPAARGEGESAEDCLARLLGDFPAIQDLLADASHSAQAPWDQCRSCSEYSYMYSHFWKPGALLLGDAACFVDVLLSSGVHLATWSAVLAAQSLNAVLSGHVDEELAMNEFETRYREEYAIFFDGLVGLYDTTLDEADYGLWLRKLLIDTNGIAFETVDASRSGWHARHRLAASRRNLQRMRDYNQRQLAYDGDPGLFDPDRPILRHVLSPTPDRRSWMTSDRRATGSAAQYGQAARPIARTRTSPAAEASTDA